MKNAILLLFGFLLFTRFTAAQIIENFDVPGSLGIFKDANWGTANSPNITDSIYQTADPAGKSAGVLGVAFDIKGHLAHNAIRPVTQSWLNPNGAHQITYWIFIPSNSGIPDSLKIELWWQVNANWKWNSKVYYPVDIPKGVWYPLSASIQQQAIIHPDSSAFTNGHIFGDFGIQWDNEKALSATWKGVIYFDNFSLVGTKPTTFATFASNLQGFGQSWSNGWVDSIKQITGPVGDSMGVAEWKLVDGSASTAGDAFGINPSPAFDAKTQNFLVFWVYVNTDFPDSANIQTWAQDNNTWNWPSPRGVGTYLGIDIPKKVWYPLYFDLSQASIADTISGSQVNAAKYPLGKIGLQITADKAWKGSIYIRSVQFINVAIPVVITKSWVAADFENATNGTEGFYVPASMVTIGTSVNRGLSTQGADRTFVLKVGANFGAEKKIIIQHDAVPLLDAADPTVYATAMSLQVFFPATMPLGAAVDLSINGTATGNKWVSVEKQIDNSTFKLGQWNTLTMNLDSLVQSGVVNPAKLATIAVQVYYPATDTSNWFGAFMLDNLTFTGISRSGVLPAAVFSKNNTIKEFKLYNNYPNPFNPSTKIQYDLPHELNVTLKVYDILGREVATLVNNQKQGSGSYSVSFDASKFASGVYIYKITAGSYVKSYKMTLLK